MNITFIGMAGAGKSTVGKRIAKRLGYDFIDIDDVIEAKTGMKLQQIIDRMGDEKFIEIEEKVVLELDNLKNHVFSPGGSIIYSQAAMDFLKRNSTVIFLDVPFRVIDARLRNRTNRGIIGLKDKPLEALFKERLILYKKYADITVPLQERIDDEKINRIIEECGYRK
jgi:shikimate kinase